MDFLQRMLHERWVQGAITGALTAAVVDFQAFRSWKSAQDALSYNWGIALWRWFQGAVVGMFASFGVGSVSA